VIDLDGLRDELARAEDRQTEAYCRMVEVEQELARAREAFMAEVARLQGVWHGFQDEWMQAKQQVRLLAEVMDGEVFGG